MIPTQTDPQVIFGMKWCGSLWNWKQFIVLHNLNNALSQDWRTLWTLLYNFFTLNFQFCSQFHMLSLYILYMKRKQNQKGGVFWKLYNLFCTIVVNWDSWVLNQSGHRINPPSVYSGYEFREYTTHNYMLTMRIKLSNEKPMKLLYEGIFQSNRTDKLSLLLYLFANPS